MQMTTSTEAPPQTANATTAPAPGEERYILWLYVAGMTSRSARAVTDVRAFCEKHLGGRYDLQVIDVYQQPALAKPEQLIAAPTLIKKLPLPSRRLIGGLSDESRVLVGLDLIPRNWKTPPMRDEMDATDQVRELTARLEEAEETLRAVRSGEIDAFIVQGPQGEQVCTLRNAEQPYRNVVEDMFEGAAILTTDGAIVYCNRRFAELVAVPLENAVGGAMERFVNSADRPAYRALLTAGAGKRQAQLTAADGRTINVFLSLTTSVCDDIERRNLIITDLSERLDAPGSRDRAERQSQAKDEFMAMLAHELRNPLSAITAAVQVLETVSSHEHEKVTFRARSIIARQVQNLSRLIDDLLDVGRVVTGKIVLDRRAVDLCDLVRRTVAIIDDRTAEHHIEVTSEPVWVEGDAVRIEQIVTNIVGNAVKYTPPGGKIRVSLSVEADEAVLRIQDSGCGITPEFLPLVFDLFVQGERTLERAQGGLGIGLTLVRRLVALHRGRVSVASDGPGRGSVFTVRLPQVAASRSAKPASASHLGTIRCRVLIVEDNHDAREMFRLMLELSGHEVLEAEEGYAGLRMLKSEAPDVAFIDVGLPGLDGYEIVRRFRGAGGTGVLLVALTGYGTPDALERSRRAGFDHHLIKPVNAEMLDQMLTATQTNSTDSGQPGAIPQGTAGSGASPSIAIRADRSLQ
ncbi:MAG: ATP-binding protein [Steroidobacteraceae bacterium]